MKNILTKATITVTQFIIILSIERELVKVHKKHSVVIYNDYKFLFQAIILLFDIYMDLFSFIIDTMFTFV